MSPSIKVPERKLWSEANHPTFVISGPDQAQRHNGKDLLKNVAFKESFAHFILQEWKNPEHGPILGRKVLNVSHGGKYLSIMNIETGSGSQIQVNEPSHLQAQHEEAHTPIAFHDQKIQRGTILVSSTDTDVLVILTSLAGRPDDTSLIKGYGSGNHRRHINVSHIADRLEEKQHGLTDTLVGLHALTGCDFTSAFNRICKVKQFNRLEGKAGERYVKTLHSLTAEVNERVVTLYVCALCQKIMIFVFKCIQFRSSRDII